MSATEWVGTTDMKINKFLYLVKEGLVSIFTHGFMSFACIMVIVACLLIMGVFSVLTYVVDLNIENLEHQNEILAFVDEELSEEEALEIGARLSAIDNVSSIEFINREQALQNFIGQYSEEESEKFSDLTPSVLRHRYVIYLNDLALMERTIQAVEAVNGIADTSAATELSHYFIALRNVISIVSGILIVILFVVSVFIMQNTIKLATFSRREEIGIMKMVGANNSFIRCPFVVEGLVLGLLGGAIAFFVLWGVYSLVMGKVMEGMMASILVIPSFQILMRPVLIIYLAMGFVVGTFGSNIAIRNYLKV